MRLNHREIRLGIASRNDGNGTSRSVKNTWIKKAAVFAATGAAVTTALPLPYPHTPSANAERPSA